MTPFTTSVLQERARLGLEVPQDTPLTVIKARIKAAVSSEGQLLTFTLYGGLGEHPRMLEAIRYAMKVKIWDWNEVIANFKDHEQALHMAKLQAQGIDTSPKIIRNNKNTQHSQARIVLHEQITVTCEETGISHTTRLPIPSALHEALNLPTVHPLAFIDNVHKVMKSYNKSGVHIERELEPQVLAGMLLTILRSKNLLICKDTPKANMFLQAAGPTTLGYAVRWFYGRTSTLNFPALALQLDDNKHFAHLIEHIELTQREKAQQAAELYILNYMKACKGESTKDDAAHVTIQPSKKHKTVKVYSDLVLKQAKDAQSAGKTGDNLIAKLTSDFPGQHKLLLERVKQHLKMLAYASEKVRKDVAAKLRDTFPANETAIELSIIFSNVKQDAIEDDLLSFTQSTHKQALQDLFTNNTNANANANETNVVKQPFKVDFMSKLANIKAGE